MWYRGSTNSTINRKHINPYKSKIRSNKAEYSTASGPYRTTHDVKVPFIMPEFSRRNVITRHFHVVNGRGDEGIIYEMIIVRNLMVKLVLKAEFLR